MSRVGLRLASTAAVGPLLSEHHYLGPIERGVAMADEDGALVLGAPTSRRLPHRRWLELVRWCIVPGRPNAGSRQWSAAVKELRRYRPDVSTVVSYSDPSAGHDGALYRASGWLWAPTWHRLREPPTGNGAWKEGSREATKDRWVYLLTPDPEREALLALDDESLARRMPWASYREPTWKRGRPVQGSGGADYRRWLAGRAA